MTKRDGAPPRKGKRSRQTVQPRGLFREGFVLTVLTLLGKMLGYVREWLTAYFFGTGIIVDSLRVALDLSKNLYFILFGNHVETTLIPILARWRTRGADNSAGLLVRVLAWGSLALSTVVAVVVAFLAPWITRLQLVGYTPEEMETVTLMIRWVSPSIPLFVACFLAAYLLGSVHRFRVFSMLALFTNTTMITALVLVGKGVLPATWLVISYSVAASAALAALIADARRWWPRKVRFDRARVMAVLQPFFINIWPLFLLAIATQSRIFIDKRIVSVLGVGSVAALWYARFIIETPAMTVGQALIRLVLPRFSEMVERRETDAIGREILKLLNVSLWALLPLVVWLAVAARPLIEVVFGYGAFDEEAAMVSAWALIGSSPALWTGVMLPLFNRVFNAQGRNKILLWVGLFGNALNITLDYILLKMIGVAGIGLALGIAQFTMMLFLLPLIPGKITGAAYRGMVTWSVPALLLFPVLLLLPNLNSPLLELFLTGGTAVAFWAVVSLVIPEGRNFVRLLIAKTGLGKRRHGGE